MKKLTLLILAIFFIVACKTKRSASTPAAEPNMDAQLTAVKARFPDATMEELKRGQTVYNGPCTNCHGKKDITGYTEDQLLGIVDKMAVKAKITPEEKQALIRFAVGVRATASK
jgi:hypothetical protein